MLELEGQANATMVGTTVGSPDFNQSMGQQVKQFISMTPGPQMNQNAAGSTHSKKTSHLIQTINRGHIPS